MTILDAKAASEYASLPDSPDPYEEQRPQRHNIVFNNGWPTDKPYSTANLEAHHTAESTRSTNNIRDAISSFTGFDKEDLQGWLHSLIGNHELSHEEIQGILNEIMNALGEAISEVGIAMGEIGAIAECDKFAFDNRQG